MRYYLSEFVKGLSSVTKWTFGFEQNHSYYESKVKEYFLCNTNVPVRVQFLCCCQNNFRQVTLKDF